MAIRWFRKPVGAIPCRFESYTLRNVINSRGEFNRCWSVEISVKFLTLRFFKSIQPYSKSKYYIYMFYTEPIFLIFSGASLIFVFFDIFILILFLKFRKKLKTLFEGKKIKNMEDVVIQHLRKTEDQEKDILKLFEQIKDLQDISQKTFQKIGTVRFNPFSDIGGNQSFAVALLDNRNNGFIISSLFIKDGSRVYAKAIKNGQSDFSLSKEEKEALEIAISTK